MSKLKKKPLSAFIQYFKDRFSAHATTMGDDGCPTCGHGGTKGISESEYECMLKEMDEWIEKTYGKKS